MSSRILIGNLPMDTTAESLLNWFDEVSHEVVVSVQTDKFGSCRGFATVETSSQDIADFIISNFDRTEFGGRTVFMHLQKGEVSLVGRFDKIRRLFGLQRKPDRIG
ncbi:MAG: hypothetical protein K8F91_12315 [Candidatus Obscuribacterales bacterium]|nr:hypothetical protein [Candidatus Obscuribacterales bacterium]